MLTRERKGALVMACPSCGRTSKAIPGRYGVCPVCLSDAGTRRYRCVRCGHEWVPRVRGALPGACPVCKSPYWCRERLPRGGSR